MPAQGHRLDERPDLFVGLERKLIGSARGDARQQRRGAAGIELDEYRAADIAADSGRASVLIGVRKRRCEIE